MGDYGVSYRFLLATVSAEAGSDAWLVVRPIGVCVSE